MGLGRIFFSVLVGCVVTPPPIGEQSIVITVSVCVSVCVCVCPRAYLWKYTSEFYQFFCECYLWPWLGPPLAALRYAMYFRFYGRRHTCA